MSSGLGIPINYFCEITTILKKFIYTGTRSRLVSEFWVPENIGKFSFLMSWQWKQVGSTEGNCGTSVIIDFVLVIRKKRNIWEDRKFSSYLDESHQVLVFFNFLYFIYFLDNALFYKVVVKTLLTSLDHYDHQVTGSTVSRQKESGKRQWAHRYYVKKKRYYVKNKN